MKYKIEKRKIKVTEYQQIRETTGWDMLDNSSVGRALSNDLFSVCIFDEEKLIGIGRVIGDGALYFYVQDVIVLPDYKGKGIGKMIMERIETFLEKNTVPGSFIGLMAAEGVKDFYKAFGYDERPKERPGMFKVIK